jgi:hypothetical protein
MSLLRSLVFFCHGFYKHIAPLGLSFNRATTLNVFTAIGT